MLTLEKTSKDDACWGTLPEAKDPLLEKYRQVRQFSEFLAEPLVPEDCVIQTMPEVSPTKWHLAHTTWFFETFILRPFLPDYQPIHPQYAYLFNSYYNAAGKMHPRPQRGLISRPTLEETFAYRTHVDNLMGELIDQANDAQMEALARLVVLGVNHEQQHQELMLTDIKHVFSMNPLHPVYRERAKTARSTGEPDAPRPLWNKYQGGIFSIGHEGDAFHFDNETPRHEVLLRPFALANTLVTNGDYLAFIEDKGYQRPEFWLSLGWMAVNERNWYAPLYWEKQGNTWWSHTLSGFRPVEENEPICHLSYFEADAYARWAGARLPTEAEWETAAADVPVEGHFVETGHYHPAPAFSAGYALQQMFGDLWQWTQSAYSPYPGFLPVAGALGEYNGKFMCNQYVLRGASCATPKSHARRTYRNFFPPDARWQFSGLRLAKDLPMKIPNAASQVADVNARFRLDFIEGMSQPQKRVPCKYLYDDEGARLFEAICELDEYYPTRTEMRLLRDNLPEIAALIGPQRTILELGSGSGAKTRLLLEALDTPAAYIPIDVSRTQLLESSGLLARDFPELQVLPLCADFTEDFELPLPEDDPAVIFFPGSTLGNLEPDHTEIFLERMASLIGSEGALLLGVDLKKDPGLLHRAYNDAQGVTAAFNLNLLARANRELDADFDLGRFRHEALYNPDAGRIEMHLISLQPHPVWVGDRKFSFSPGESICTEHSYKYSLGEFRQVAERANLRVARTWTDDQEWFSLQYLLH